MTPAIRIAALVALMAMAMAATAQDVVTSLPDAPSVPVASQRKVMDWKFISLSLAGKGALAADYTYTRLDLDAGYAEHNRLLGRQPSNARLAIVGVAWDTGLDLIGYKLKQHGARYWWVPRVAQIVINTKFAIHNAQASRTRYVCSETSFGVRECRPR